MKDISIFGTCSDVGKSTLTFVIARLLQQHGIATTVFKAQNVSNNAQVADDGSEIAVSQAFQASVLQVPTSYRNNPVLLKSGQKSTASLIVKGKTAGEKDVRRYYQDIDLLKPVVKEAFTHLQKHYECVVAEGAGSPVELNLMDKDLSNIYVASEFDTKIILVADIEKGGVFASIWGVYNLLPPKLRGNIIGVVINKFRGDKTLFDEGVAIIEQRFGIAVLGVLPFKAFNLGFEDSQSLGGFMQAKTQTKLKAAVISYPAMSNYNDLEPLIADKEVQLEFIDAYRDLEGFDIVILPGSKLVFSDLAWLQETGLFEAVKRYGGMVFGICGGYEMLFEILHDNDCVESESTVVKGFGFIPGSIVFTRQKTVRKQQYNLFGLRLGGFEIHHGQSQNHPLYFQNENIWGTFVHGVFDNDAFRKMLFATIRPDYTGFDFSEYRQNSIDAFVAQAGSHLDIQRVIDAL